MTGFFRGLAAACTLAVLWWLGLVVLGLAARLTYLGLATGWGLI